MAGSRLYLPKFLADSLNEQFGSEVMEIVATEFIIKKLLDDFGKQTNSSIDNVQACLDQAFNALMQARGISPEQRMRAREGFEQLGSQVKGVACPNVPYF